MRVLERSFRFTAITIAALFIGISVVGLAGVWWVDRSATEAVLKGFGFVEAAVGVVEAGVGRADDLIATSRTEVRQAADTITTVGARPEANRAVLSGLSERLSGSLAPRIAQIQQALSPVRDAVAAIGNAVSLMNSLPMLADRAPRLGTLDESFSRLEGLAADTTQLRGTLQALVAAQTGELAPETIATINALTQRIDQRLGEVQANVDGVQGEIAALKDRLEQRKSRLLFLFHLVALLAAALCLWILYSQVVVIRHHRARVRRAAVSNGG